MSNVRGIPNVAQPLSALVEGMAGAAMIGWLFGPSDTITGWTPQRAAQAEREMLTREGIVTEPHYLWSAPAKERERLAQIRRLNSWRKRTQAQEARRA